MDAPLTSETLAVSPPTEAPTLETCPACDGTGEIERYHTSLSHSPYRIDTCERCDGTGEVAS